MRPFYFQKVRVDPREHDYLYRPGFFLTVSDDGPGIPPQFREAVFDPLRTLKPRDVCEGSGMGLAIARKIVTRLGGTISLAETEGTRGTTVSFTLPGHDPAQPARLN